jgi:hypothetical protein
MEVGMTSRTSERTTPHYFTRQEIFRVYADLRIRHPEGINFNALFIGIMRHTNLSRVTRHIGNNFDQYMMHDIDVVRMKEIRRDFDDVARAYDHDLDETVVIEARCPVMQAFWIAAIADETMDFSIPFIRYTGTALNNAVMTFIAIHQDQNSDLLELETKLFEGMFAFSGAGRKGPEINVPQLLWNAMIDRDVAKHYTELYIDTLMEPEDMPSGTPPTNSHLH